MAKFLIELMSHLLIIELSMDRISSILITFKTLASIILHYLSTDPQLVAYRKPQISQKDGLLVSIMICLKLRIKIMSIHASLSKRKFPHGNNIFGFRCLLDLISGGAKSLGFFNPIKHGSVRLQLKFDKALESTITALIHFDFDTFLEINAERNVVYNFN